MTAVSPGAVVLGTAAEAIAAAREYATSIAAGAIRRDRSGAVPAAELAALDASGLLAITMPREHGGPDLRASVLAEAVRSIAAVDPAIAQVTQPHFLFVDMRISMAGAWTSIVAAELIAATSELGYLIMQAGDYLNTALVFSGIITIAILGLALDACLRGLLLLADPSRRR